MKYRNKYGSKKTVVDNIVFDSRKEARRYSELKLLQRAGVISDLKLQEEFELIPAQFETISTAKGKTKRVCVERAVKYRADFSYIENGRRVVEDTKGVKTKEYIIKRKLMRYIHGVKIREI